MTEENLENSDDIVCCIKCKRGFKKIRSFYNHHSWENPEYRKKMTEMAKEKMEKRWESSEYREKNIKILKKRVESLEFKEKAKKRMEKRWESLEYRNKQSKMSKEMWKNTEIRNKIMKGTRESFEKNPERRRKVSESTKKLWQNPKHREKLTNMIKLRWQDSEYRKKTINTMRLQWQNLEYKNKMVKTIIKANSIKPNKCEQLLQQALDGLYPNEYKFVGNGEVVIGGFCPDFINCNGKKLIIEFDGKYWHSSEKIKEKDQQKLTKYKELGFDTLVIKENEFKNDKEGVKNRIVEFVKNYEKEHYGLLI